MVTSSMPSRFRSGLRVAIAVACLAGALAVPAAGGPATTKVTVTMTDYRFHLSVKSVHRGVVVFVVVNKGQVGHIFEIQRLRKLTPLLQPGGRSTLRVTFRAAGRYYYLCPVDNHVLYGMTGYLRVT
jgi:plastocyanin